MTGGADYDIVISGGGMVGATLACALARLPVRVALVETVPFASVDQPSFDERTTALARGSQRILEGIGVWSRVAAVACPIRSIHVSERGRFGTAVINARQQGVADLGYVVANRSLGAALWQQIEAASNVAVFCPASVAEPRATPDRIGMLLAVESGGSNLTARLLVVADGARSALREALGIGVTERSYDQTAVVGNVGVSTPADPTMAYERFTADGPVALLPFHDGRYVFVLARTPKAAEDALNLDEAAFLELLQQQFGGRLGRFTRLGRRSAYPLSLVRALRVTAPRAVVVGNAANGLHPVAGQGYNLGLRDVATLAEVIADAVRAGEDPGSSQALERYRVWRTRDQANVVAFTDGLIRLFGVRFDALGAARGMALAAFDILPFAKRRLAEHTMGTTGRLTRLARGLPL